MNYIVQLDMDNSKHLFRIIHSFFIHMFKNHLGLLYIITYHILIHFLARMSEYCYFQKIRNQSRFRTTMKGMYPKPSKSSTKRLTLLGSLA